MSAHLLLLLQDDLVDRLAGQALAEGRDPAELVVDILADELPDFLASAVREVLVSEQNPPAAHREVLVGDVIGKPNAEHQHTARPALKAPSGGET